jgi:hypothetical protein
MSAFIVEISLIDALLTLIDDIAKEANQPLTRDDLDQLGYGLLFQNYRSVNHRYRENSTTPAYRFCRHTAMPGPVAIVKACDCLDYQSSETPDWETTAACKALARIKRLALVKAGFEPFSDAYRDHPDYEKSLWGMIANPNRPFLVT